LVTAKKTERHNEVAVAFARLHRETVNSINRATNLPLLPDRDDPPTRSSSTSSSSTSSGSSAHRGSICRDWQAGKCSRNNNCKYAHDTKISIRNVPSNAGSSHGVKRTRSAERPPHGRSRSRTKSPSYSKSPSKPKSG
jgi:hypothetical protein